MAYRRGLPLIGRDRELSVLGASLAAAQQGRPQILLVTGAPGAGKSTLVEYFLEDAATVQTLRGGCREGGLGVPFGPFAEALRPTIRVPGAVSNHLLPYLRALADGGAEDSVDAAATVAGSRTRLFEALLEFFADLDDGAILAIDDLQWADTSSLELLTFLVRNLRHEPLLVILVCRDEMPAPVRDVLEEIRRAVRLTHVAIGGFGPAELASAFVAARGTTPTPDDLKSLAEVTAGNAFFVEQVLLSPTGDGRLPFAVRTLLVSDLDTLPPPAQRVAELVAVAGGRAPVEVLEEALGVGAGEAIDRAMSGPVTSVLPGTVELRHSLYREAILSRISPARVHTIHAELATLGEALAERGQRSLSADEIARHWVASGEIRRSIPALARAARLADGALAFREALSLWTVLLQNLEGLERHTESERLLLLEALGAAANASRWVGKPARSVDLLTRALALTSPSDREVRARYHGQRAYYRRLCGEIDDAVWDAERAAALLDPADPAQLRAAVIGERARLVVLRGDVLGGLTLARIAVALAREALDPALEARALSTLGVAEVNSGSLDVGVASLHQARRLAATYGDFEDNIRLANNLSFAMLAVGRVREGLAAATEAIELARRVGVEGRSGSAAVAQDNAIAALITLGQWDEAQTRMDRILAGEPDDVIHHGWLLGTRAQLSAATGRFDDASRDLALLHHVAHPSAVVRQGAAVATAELACWQHRPEDACRAVKREVSDDQSLRLKAYLLTWYLRGLGDLADLARLRRDTVTARDAGERATTCLGRYLPDLEATGLTHLDRSLLRAELQRTLDGGTPLLWEIVSAANTERPYDRAYALCRQAETLLRDKAPLGRGSAERLLGEADRLAGDCGAAPMRQWINHLALRHEIVPRSTSPTPRSAPLDDLRLTAREREVLAQLVRGMTNRRIGRALDISEKTASVHVSNILGKLGVANRTAAAAVAHQLGL